MSDINELLVASNLPYYLTLSKQDNFKNKMKRKLYWLLFITITNTILYGLALKYSDLNLFGIISSTYFYITYTIFLYKEYIVYYIKESNDVLDFKFSTPFNNKILTFILKIFGDPNPEEDEEFHKETHRDFRYC
jgi:hypothetical protein